MATLKKQPGIAAVGHSDSFVFGRGMQSNVFAIHEPKRAVSRAAQLYAGRDVQCQGL